VTVTPDTCLTPSLRPWKLFGNLALPGFCTVWPSELFFFFFFPEHPRHNPLLPLRISVNFLGQPRTPPPLELHCSLPWVRLFSFQFFFVVTGNFLPAPIASFPWFFFSLDCPPIILPAKNRSSWFSPFDLWLPVLSLSQRWIQLSPPPIPCRASPFLR